MLVAAVRDSPRFKRVTIIPLPEKSRGIGLIDSRLVALTFTVLKCFERLVMARIDSYPSKDLDLLQLDYLLHKSTVNAVSLVLRSSGQYLRQATVY